MGLIYAKGLYLRVRTCELFLWFASRFECVDFFVFFRHPLVLQVLTPRMSSERVGRLSLRSDAT